MKEKTITYRLLTKAIAVSLLAGILIPSALQAKQLMDFCMMEMMNHHEMVDDSHECCKSETAHHSNTQAENHDCENGTICACPVNDSPIKNQFRIPVSSSSTVILSPTGFNFMVTSPDEFIHKEYFAHASADAPPLYLLYDTFLN